MGIEFTVSTAPNFVPDAVRDAPTRRSSTNFGSGSATDREHNPGPDLFHDAAALALRSNASRNGPVARD